MILKDEEQQMIFSLYFSSSAVFILILNPPKWGIQSSTFPLDWLPFYHHHHHLIYPLVSIFADRSSVLYFDLDYRSSAVAYDSSK
ncbi:unnamed protein product, partial [Eruca vesicaria subsp. sativa]|nr:unnamed protein product [Eruca vesicaria subsp. sativa]